MHSEPAADQEKHHNKSQFEPYSEISPFSGDEYEEFDYEEDIGIKRGHSSKDMDSFSSN